MRVTVLDRGITLPSEQPVKVRLEVTNTLEVIDGIVATAVMPPGTTATVTPKLLPLFPDGVGQLTVELRVSATFPAGAYDIPVEVGSSAASDAGLVEALHVVVPPAPAGQLTILPVLRSARHRARYTVVCENTGNTTLEVALAASDPEHDCMVTFSAPVLSVEPGGSATSDMTVARRRRLLGGDTSIELLVLGTSSEIDLETKAVLRHRPVIARGVRVALVLGAIVALWAGIFVVVLDHALAKDPLKKAVPASFYASVSSKADKSKLDALEGGKLGLVASEGSAPAGAVPKSGVVVGVGGTISGTVRAKSTSAGIGRISVDAYQDTPAGEQVVASAATTSSGSYSIAGLLPGSYTIEFKADGYDTAWYPKATSQSAAKTVTVRALATTGAISTVIDGEPGSIRGQVETGETPAPPVTVTVEPSEGATTKPIATVKTTSSGTYTIKNLPAPDTYDLSFSSKGYRVATDSEEIEGGEAHVANTVTLSAAAGSLAGVVTSGGHPLGGVAVTAKANGKTYTTATPTTGDVGAFTLSGLPSPATYLLTFTESGYGSKTVGEALGPGQTVTDLHEALSGGAGTITGEVTTSSGAALGGVTVTTYLGSTTTSSQTLTAGQVGQFELSGLSTPGTYTLTFTLAGYTTETISVALGSSGSRDDVDVKMPSAAGSISGTVDSDNAGLAGVTVSLTNGTTVMSTMSASQPPGAFSFTGLAAGSYTVTLSLTGYNTVTYLVTLTSGQAATIAPAMTKAS